MLYPEGGGGSMGVNICQNSLAINWKLISLYINYISIKLNLKEKEKIDKVKGNQKKGAKNRWVTHKERAGWLT